MSFLDIVKAFGPYVAAGGDIASSASENRAKGRAAESVINQAQDRGSLDRYSAEQLAKLGGTRLLEEATQDRADRFLTDSQKRAQQVGLGDLLANVQDVSLGGLPSYIPHMSFSGGLRPSALGPNARAAGQNLSRQALEAQLSGADIPNLPDVSGIGTAAPGQTPLPQAGKFDSILNMLGYAGMGAGALEEIAKQKRGAVVPEASIPRWDTSAGLGTPVGIDEDMTGQRAQANAAGAATAGRGNIARLMALAAQAQQRGGG